MDKETLSENEFLKETAPALFEKKIEIDITPPSGYFDSLPAKMSTRIASDFPEKEKPKGLLRYINFSNLAAAAGVALILALWPAVSYLTSDAPAADQSITTSLTSYEAEAAMDWYAADEDIDLIELFGADTPTDLFAELTFAEDVTGDDMENYLIREGISDDEIAALMSEDIYDY